jgi:hypothetical protein
MPSRTPVPVESLLLLALLALVPGPAGARDPALDPARVGWSEIRMTARKFFLTAESRLALRVVPGDAVTPGLLAVDNRQFTPLAAGKEVLELVYDTRGVGRKSQLTLLMDPVSGAALQRVQHDQGGKPRFRTYRFGLEGAYHRTFWPATASEETLPPGAWTRTTEGLRAYPLPPDEHPVMEATGLLYAIAAAPLDRPGDAADMLVFRRRDTQAVRVTVLPPRQVAVRYDEVRPTGTVRRDGTVTALRLSLRGVPGPGGDPQDQDVELLGLRGELELLLDTATRAPLELSGDVKVVGNVTLQLAELHPR